MVREKRDKGISTRQWKERGTQSHLCVALCCYTLTMFFCLVGSELGYIIKISKIKSDH